MGEKYNLKFLSDLENKNILLNISETMYRFNWYYNTVDCGRYSFWKNKPIWHFGDSKEIVEHEMDDGNNLDKLRDIISNISSSYSQSIVYNKLINKKVTSVIAAIVESTNMVWKEVSISFELNELLTSDEDLDKISREVKEIFKNLSINLKSFYAMAAIEMRGLVEEPESLKIEVEMFGDYNYFSYNCSNIKYFVNNSTKYEIEKHGDIGIFVYTVKQIGAYS